MTFSESDWLRILSELGVRSTTAAEWAAPFADEVQPGKFSAGMRDLTDWLPEVLHESTGTNQDTGHFGLLERLEECLSYTPERMHEVWPNRFPTLASAVPYTHAPQRLSNFVYASRMGNGDVASGDGWAFRGRGLIQITGRAAYARVGDLVGQDLLGVPDLTCQHHFGLQIAIGWWEGSVPDEFLGDQVKVRRRVNGGLTGLADVEALRTKLQELLA